MRLSRIHRILVDVHATTSATIPSVFLLTTIISYLIGGATAQMDAYVGHPSTSAINPTYCYKLAHLCRSRNRRIRDLVRRKCPLACGANRRASVCCRNMEVSRECRPLCGYDFKSVQNFVDSGLNCVNELPKIMLCVAQDQDVRDCCTENAVGYDGVCMEMCDRGRVAPPCTFKEMISLEQCLIGDIPRILQCFLGDISYVQPLLRAKPFSRHACPNQIDDLKKLLGADQINYIDFLRRRRARRSVRKLL